MSNSYYENQLREGVVGMKELLMGEEPTPPPNFHNPKQELVILQGLSASYVQYLITTRKMEEVFDQLTQPQKRAEVRVLLDCCLGRILEIRDTLVRHGGEYINFDDVLVDLKLTPDVLEVPIPRYIREDRRKELEERQRFLDALTKQYAKPQPVSEQMLMEPLPQLSADQAVQLVQANERGRQGRQRARFMKEIREQEDRERKLLEFGTIESDPMEAATKIQKIFKGYLARNETTRIRKEELEFLGMAPSGVKEKKSLELQLKEVKSKRKLQQMDNQRELDQDRVATRERIKQQEGGKIMEDMHDRVLQRVLEIRELRGTSPDEEKDFTLIPTMEEGTIEAFLRDWTPEEVEQYKEQQRLKREAEKEKQANKKGKKEKDGKKKKDGGKKGKKAKEEEKPPEEPTGGKFWQGMAEGLQRYVDVWQKRYDGLDFDQKHDKHLLRETIMEGGRGEEGLRHELMAYVQSLVLVEIENLKAALEKDNPKRKGKKGKKGKKGGKKGKKGKKDKDLTAGKNIEALLNELFWAGFVQSCPAVRLEEYVGTHNLMATVLDQADKFASEQVEDVQKKYKQAVDNWSPAYEASFGINLEQLKSAFGAWQDKKIQEGTPKNFEPSMAQVRQLCAEYGVIPLGSREVHDNAPHPRTLLLYGPKGTGKTMLTYAITHEAGASLFNITVSRIQDKYNNARAIQMLVHMVFKVARAMAPSVIYLDEAEKVFKPGGGKKKAAGDKAGKIRKELEKQMKELDPNDRVLVIGNTNAPWESLPVYKPPKPDDDKKAKKKGNDQKKKKGGAKEKKKVEPDLVRFFDRAIYCVSPDYASRLELWTTLIEKKGATLKSPYDAETLAYMSNKYTSGTISKVINTVLTERRRKRLGQRPLTAQEFLAVLAKVTPVFKEEFEAFKLLMTIQLPEYKPAWTKAIFWKPPEEEEEDKNKKKKGKKKKAPAE